VHLGAGGSWDFNDFTAALDDLVSFSESPEHLVSWREAIERFLAERLRDLEKRADAERRALSGLVTRLVLEELTRWGSFLQTSNAQRFLCALQSARPCLAMPRGTADAVTDGK
jgi:hypothetical protein